MYGRSGMLGRGATLFQMLSLYLLLLAFFVLLYNHSRIEDAKAKKVAGSIHATFADKGVNADRPVPLTSLLADSLAEADFQRRMGKLVRTEIPIAEIDVVSHGRLLRARMPIGELFTAGSRTIRGDRVTLVRRIAQALNDHPPGIRYDLDVVIGGRWITPRMLDRVAPIEVARAASIGAVLQRAGVPEGSVAVGIRQGDEGWLLLNFHVRSEEEGRFVLPVDADEETGG